MATVTVYTAAKMDAIANNTIISAAINGSGDLILTKGDGTTTVNAGHVIGATGAAGPTGPSITVCTSTTRPSTPATGAQIFETDSKLTYIYTGTAWRYSGGLIICTSTTRPTMPIEGLTIYETDTDKVRTWNNYRWDLPWNEPWGLIGYAKVTPSVTGIGSTPTDITGQSVTWTPVGNRIYEIRAEGNLLETTGDTTVTVSIYSPTLGIIESSAWTQLAGVRTAYSFAAIQQTLAGGTPVTMKVQVSNGGGAFTNTGGSLILPQKLIVKDLGPSGSPASA